MNEKTTILLVDDHALMRDSLGRLLESDDQLDVVGTAGDADEGIEMLQKNRADIVLMDIDMPGVSCFEAASRMALMQNDVRIIFLSAFYNDRYIQQALDVKAKGYLIKSESPMVVVDAIKTVASGKVYFSDEVRSRIVADSRGVRLEDDKKARISTLSRREVEVLGYLAKGLSKKEIAEIMHISIKTIEGHVEKVMNKLDIHDRVELARYAIREGVAEA